MTDPKQEKQEAVRAAVDLTGAVGDLAAEVKRLRTYGRRNRWFVVIDIVLTAGLAVSGAVSVHSADVAAQANKAQLALCQASNVARAQQVGLWMYLFTIAGPPKTAEEQKLDSEFKHHLRVIFAPRDCSRLGQATGPAARSGSPSPSALPGRTR